MSVSSVVAQIRCFKQDREMDNNTVIKHVKRSTDKEVKVSLVIMWVMLL